MARIRSYRYLNFVTACLQSGFRELWTHKLRSLLSIGGVTLGVASFMTLQALGDYQLHETEAFVEEVGGRNMLNIVGRQALDAKDAVEMARSPGLRFSDLDSLKARVPGVRSLSKLDMLPKMTFSIGNEAYLCNIIGANQDFMNRHRIDFGRDITDREYEEGADVGLMTLFLWKKLQKAHGLKFEQMLGRRLYLSPGVAPEIVGVFSKEKVGEQWYIYKNSVFTPLRYFEKNISGVNIKREELYMGLEADADSALVRQRIRTELTRLHRGVLDFTFRNEDWAANMQGTMEKMRFTLMLITFLSLLVGGLNIMNVMLTSVSARVREIGIRSAVGASQQQIFLQFLFEACFLSLFGGGFGLLLGSMSTSVVFTSLIPDAPTASNFIYVLQGALVSVSIGVLFGLFPALRAYRMKPVTALHYE
ncbi:MAG: FtsX-like permease family protein [Fibrobacterota bacterium]